MDIYHHLIENIQNDQARNKPTENTTQLPDKKFYVPQDLKDIQKQRYYKERNNKNRKEVVGFEKSHLIFQRDWKDLNKAQKMNRIIEYAKQNNMDKQDLLVAFEKRKISDVKYDTNNGQIVELTLKE